MFCNQGEKQFCSEMLFLTNSSHQGEFVLCYSNFSSVFCSLLFTLLKEIFKVTHHINKDYASRSFCFLAIWHIYHLWGDFSDKNEEKAVL